MDYLLNISLRSAALAAFAAVCLWRVKSPALKHAVWTVVVGAMLLQMVLSSVLPSLPLPVLRPVELIAVPVTAVSGSITMAAPPSARVPALPILYAAGVLFFAARLLRAFVFTRRLLNRAERVGLRLFQSPEIAVPVTASSKILLPLSWREWDAGKLRAVLAHEEAHVRRRDSIVALLARVNRCVFWFHPLAWWLERDLAQLAEQACDDAAVAATRDCQQYARTLLDMAQAVHASQGRFLTAAMAKEANVETRIDRILDETRSIPRALGRAGWTILVTAATPLVYFLAAAQLAPAQTFMSIPAPAGPPPPVLIAQAAPAPAPPAPVPPAPVPAPVAPQEPQTTRSRYNYFGGTLGGPIFIPKVYNGHNKTFFFYAYQEFKDPSDLAAQTTPPPQEPQPLALGPDLKVSVDITTIVAGSVGLATIGIPFPEAGGRYDIFAVLQDQNGTDVFKERPRLTDAGWSTAMTLKPGAYVLKVLVRNNVNGRISTNQTDFEVK